MLEECANLLKFKGCLAALVFTSIGVHRKMRRLDLHPVVVVLGKGKPGSAERGEGKAEKERGSWSGRHSVSDVIKEPVKVKRAPLGSCPLFPASPPLHKSPVTKSPVVHLFFIQ